MSIRGRPIRNQAKGLIAIVGVLSAIVLMIGLLGRQQVHSSVAGVAVVPLRSMPHTDVNPYGANFFLQWEAEPWKVDRTLQMAGEAGLGWVKQQFPWEELEPKKGRYWDDRQNRSTWEKYDRIVELAAQNGMQVIARLDRPPAWTRKDNTLREAPPDNFEDYGNFVYAVVSHYRGKIRYYQLWNEPNIRPEWGSQTPDPAKYAELLRIGYQRAKEADPNVYILSAPLAQTLERSPFAYNDLDYLEGLYRAGAKDYFDILFANAYGFSVSPDDPADPQVLNFRRVELSRQIMERYGDAGKPIWFNEFGWNASPDTIPLEARRWGQVTEQQQAQYTMDAVREARAEWPWAGIFCIWYFRQAGQITPDHSDYYFRMVDVGFTPRLLYRETKAQAASLFVASPGDYQSTNPAVRTEGAWRLVRDGSATDGLATVSEQAGDSMEIAFEGGEIDLMLVTGPDGGIASITVDGAAANMLPSDRMGRSYLDFYGDKPGEKAVVPVSRGLPSGQHRLKLTVSGNRNSASKGSVVSIDGFSVRQIEGASTWTTIILFSALGFTSMVCIYLWLIHRPRDERNGR